jgi:hypothetical protein
MFSVGDLAMTVKKAGTTLGLDVDIKYWITLGLRLKTTTSTPRTPTC